MTTAGGDNYRGECYNDSEFSGTSTRLSISGFTTSTSHKIIFTAAAGQSFQDAAGVRTNALKYNQSNGVGLRTTVDYTGSVINVDNANIQVTRLQVKADGSHDIGIAAESASTSNVLLQDCICQGVSRLTFGIYGSGCLAINVCGYLSGSSGNGCNIKNGAKAIGCVLIRDPAQTAAGTGAVSAYTNSVLQSCAFFGFSTCVSASGWDTTNSKNNATDQSSGLPGSSNQHSVTFNSTSPFTNAAAASLNLIAIAATTLAANGFLDGTNAPNDISGYARAATPTIGAWEITAAGGASIVPVLMAQYRMRKN